MTTIATPEPPTTTTTTERLDHLDEQVSTILSAVQSVQAHVSPPAAPVPPSDVWYYPWAAGTWAIAEASTIPEPIATHKVGGQSDADRGYWLHVRRDRSPQKLVERLNQAAVHFSADNPIATLADQAIRLANANKRKGESLLAKLDRVCRLIDYQMFWMDEKNGCYMRRSANYKSSLADSRNPFDGN
jgi:hypothetical protein